MYCSADLAALLRDAWPFSLPDTLHGIAWGWIVMAGLGYLGLALPYLVAVSSLRLSATRDRVTVQGLDPAAATCAWAGGCAVSLAWWLVHEAVRWAGRGTRAVDVGAGGLLAALLLLAVSSRLTLTVRRDGSGAGFETILVRRVCWWIPWRRRRGEGRPTITEDGWGDEYDPEVLAVEVRGSGPVTLGWNLAGDAPSALQLNHLLNAAVDSLRQRPAPPS